MQRSVHLVMLTQDWRPYDQVKDALYLVASEIGKRAGWSVTVSTRRGSSIIPLARNAAVSQFLDKGGTDLIFCDSDNYCDPAAMVRLLDWPVDVVGIPCRSKSEPLTWPVRFLHNTPMEPIDPVTRRPRADGLMPVETVGTGIMRITRACLEKMIAASPPNDWYHDPTSTAKKSWPLFMNEIENHDFWGEDVWFCLKWQRLGGEVWIDPHTVSHHIGPREFSHSVAGWLAESSERMEVKSVVDNAFFRRTGEGLDPAATATPKVATQTVVTSSLIETAAALVARAEAEERAA